MAVVIIAAEFHKDIIEKMIEAAKDELKAQGKEVLVKKVAGCYEMPLLADKVMQKGSTEAVVVLSFIEKGETQHGEVMGYVVHKALVDLQLKHGKPIGIGIIGPGATKEQASLRAEPYARGAVKAALQSLSVINFAEALPHLTPRLTPRPMKFKGVVVKGKGRGAKLGFPTINLHVPQESLAGVKEGIWVALAKIGKKKLPSVAFLGEARTFSEKEKRLEVYIFNFNKKLYGKKVEVDFLKRIRGNKKFKTKKALISQMEKDEVKARQFFKNVYRHSKKHRQS